jgi:hypothetical protein
MIAWITPFCWCEWHRRCFEALGFDEYWESHGDGLQILRYNQTTAYTSHMDWIEDKVRALGLDFHQLEETQWLDRPICRALIPKESCPLT